MRRDSICTRRLRILTAAASAAMGFTSIAYSSVALDPSSTAKITHDSDISSGTAPTSHKNVNPLPDSGSIYPKNGYSYGSTTLTMTSGSNSATSSAAGSVGAVTNSANVGFTLSSGTGITQNDPSGKVFNDDSELKFDLHGLWDVGTGGYGGGAYGYVSFTLGSTIPSGGSAEVDIDLTWTNPNTGHSYRSAYHLAQPITGSTTAISNAAKLDSGSVIASGAKILVSGTITLLVRDPCGPVTITPTDFEASSTPAVWKFNPPLGTASLNFASPANWINVMGAANEPSPVPNQAGARALFQGSGTLAAPVTITQSTTIGMLDIDQPGVNFASAGALLIFDTLGSNAVLTARIDHDTTSAGHTISVPLVLNKTLEINNDAAGAIVLTQPVTGAGGIEKNGTGEVIMTSAGNAFAGLLDINQGALTLNGALPNNGAVNVNAGGAIAGAGNGATGRLGNLTLNGGSIRPGSKSADGSVGTLTMNSLNILSGNLRPDLFSPAVADRVNVTGAATLSGPLTITPVIGNLQTFSAGSYTLLSAAALNLLPGSTPILQGVPTTSRFTFALDAASVPNTILLNVTGSAPKAIRWAGGSTPNWDVNTSQNWLDLSSNPEHYFDFDSVLFDDTATTSDVILDAQISPNSVAFTNSSRNYSLISSTGTGGITGVGGLTKSGSGMLAMGVSNSYSGATQVMGGTLMLGASSALSPNSTILLGSDTSAAAIDLNGFSPTVGGLSSAGSGTNKIITNSAPVAATLNYAGGSSNFGATIQDGNAPVALHVLSGTLVLTGSNTNSGATTIDNLSQDNGDLPNGVVATNVATLQVGNGGTTGNLGTGDVIDNGALVFNRSDNIVVANNIGGSGQVIKSGSGTLVLAGNNSFNGGLDVTAGALSFSSDNNLGAPNAPVTLDGGRLNIPAGFTSTRPVYLGMAGGTIDTGATNTTFDNVSGCGTLTKLGSAMLTVNSVAAEVLNLNAGKIVVAPGRDPVFKHSYVETLNIANGATLDLNDNDLILDYENNDVPDPTKLGQIKALIASGFNFGSWDGMGITSSAAGNPTLAFPTALGYAEASTTGLSVFDTVPTDGDMILVRYTLAGDANLDGKVNALDFNALAANYGKPNSTWVKGDFDYNGVVDTSDFVELAMNFGHTLLPGPALGALAPEPSMLCLLMMPLVRTRRRRTSADR